MSNLMIFLIGFGVFSLLLTGLYLSAQEFLRVSERPDTVKGKNVTPFRRIEHDRAA